MTSGAPPSQSTSDSPFDAPEDLLAQHRRSSPQEEAFASTQDWLPEGDSTTRVEQEIANVRGPVRKLIEPEALEERIM